MRLRLKEDPREWRKFLLAGLAFAGLLIGLAYMRSWLGLRGVTLAGAALAVVGLTGWCRPAWVRPVYRAAMTLSHHVGGVVGRILLAVIFLLVVTPIGLLLRLARRDLLERRREADAATYWRHPTRSGSLDSMH